MIKIEIDPITCKILSYCMVLPSTPIYKDDILLEDTAISSMSLDKYYINGEVISKAKSEYEEAIDALEAKLLECNNLDEQQYFFDLVKNGCSLKEARTLLTQKLTEKSQLEQEYEQLKTQHKEDIYSFYAKAYKEKEKLMKFQYYSSVVLLVKDENKYLSEWISWYQKLGFHHLFIYDNGMVEDVNDLIDTLDENLRNMVTVTEWKDTYENIQEDAYNHFLKTYGQLCKWCLFVDSDEFLRFTSDVADVNEFLKNYDDYTEIWGYLEEYNANGHVTYEDKPVRERFTQKFDKYEMYYWKNFIQVNRIDCFHRHYAYYDNTKGRCYRNENINKDLFVIEHYYTKSWEEWKEKILIRGACDPDYKRKLNDFFKYNPDMSHLMEADVQQAYQKGKDDKSEQAEASIES